ncbi:hypothetical protein SAMN05421827_10648 [Pedobacter terrae]|uniref:Lipoprotein n=1 Tax=Pedobacter terrae TaxID=405671 RepID=A0A1G7TVH7_9SPHI|nr:hypothetical protein [Pedobacter terrae]SDG39024.1 hypothetical protein SAMN05421827_10648 [Pedobacter terrae]
MKNISKIKLQLFTLLFLLVLVCACSPKLYVDENKRYQAGTLSEAQIDSLHLFLKQNERLTLKDTIIIKYDFNKDGCWNDLNYQNAEFLNNVRWAFQKNIQEKAEARPQVAIYQYREKGESFSPIKSKGLEIETDSDFLKKLLFKEVTTCGTSAIVLPNGKFLLVKSDPQFSALMLNAQDIEQKLQETLVR